METVETTYLEQLTPRRTELLKYYDHFLQPKQSNECFLF